MKNYEEFNDVTEKFGYLMLYTSNETKKFY